MIFCELWNNPTLECFADLILLSTRTQELKRYRKHITIKTTNQQKNTYHGSISFSVATQWLCKARPHCGHHVLPLCYYYLTSGFRFVSMVKGMGSQKRLVKARSEIKDKARYQFTRLNNSNWGLNYKTHRQGLV